MAYGDFKDLKIRTFSDKVLRNKAFNIEKNPKLMDIKEDLLLWFTIFFDKKSTGGGVNKLVEFNAQLAEELHKPIIRKF